MSVFVRASLQGPPKTSPGHVALHHMPGLPMNLQNSPPQQRPNAAKAHTARAQASATRIQASATRAVRPGALHALAGQL